MVVMTGAPPALVAVTAVCLSFGAGMLCFEGLLPRLPLPRKILLLALSAAAVTGAAVVLAVTWTGPRT